MNLLSKFSRIAPNRVFFAILLGALAGVLYAALIPLVLMSSSIRGEQVQEDARNIVEILGVEVTDFRIAVTFLLACILILSIRTASELILMRISGKLTRQQRKFIYQKITKAPIAAIEKIGLARVYSSINIDVPRIVNGCNALPALLVNGITLIGMLLFILYLNAAVFTLSMLAILMGIVIWQIPMAIGRKIFENARAIEGGLQEMVKSLIMGSKELKLDKNKMDKFVTKTLYSNEDQIYKENNRALDILMVTHTFGDLISFFVMGIVSFIFVNYYSISREELIGVIMALVYLTRPVTNLLSSIPQFLMASVCYKNQTQLLNEIPEEDISDEVFDVGEWQHMEIRNVEYSYQSKDGERPFHIGPVNISLRKGEINFIVGANGSGKSTLSKVITQHYLPSAGAIYFDNVKVDKSNITSYRQNFGAIYSDYYLFEELLIDVTQETQLKANLYLKKLQLQDKVSINNGTFSTLKLSDGQRKRLALLVTFLEDKQVYLFDEWAADQDPDFKDIFYKEILADLKRQGKLVLVISHDDRYFHIADKLMVMQEGNLTIEHNEVKTLANICN